MWFLEFFSERTCLILKPKNTKNCGALIILITNSTTKLTTKLITIPKAIYRISRR
jgi:hypothetical protein